MKILSDFNKRLERLDIQNSKTNQTGTTHSEKSEPHSSSSSLKIVTAASTEVYVWGGGKMIPQKLDQFAEANTALAISVGGTHAAAITIERELYTWAVSWSENCLIFKNSDIIGWR